MPMPSFADANGGQQIFVNPLLVQAVRRFGEATWIVFDKDHYLTVQESPAQVAEKIWEALRAARG